MYIFQCVGQKGGPISPQAKLTQNGILLKGLGSFSSKKVVVAAPDTTVYRLLGEQNPEFIFLLLH